RAALPVLFLCAAAAPAQAPGAAADLTRATRPDPVALVAQAEKQLGKTAADDEASALLLWQALDELAAQPAVPQTPRTLRHGTRAEPVRGFAVGGELPDARTRAGRSAAALRLLCSALRSPCPPWLSCLCCSRTREPRRTQRPDTKGTAESNAQE
ncbi:MAG: hypothetical protein ACK5S5_10910, partial [Planctomycetota bacterium]